MKANKDLIIYSLKYLDANQELLYPGLDISRLMLQVPAASPPFSTLTACLTFAREVRVLSPVCWGGSGNVVSLDNQPKSIRHPAVDYV